jgi:hypothetical protein
MTITRYLKSTRRLSLYVVILSEAGAAPSSDRFSVRASAESKNPS